METYTLKFRNILSTWLNLFIFILMMFYLVYIEFFQDTQINYDKTNLLKSPIQKEFLTNATEIKFKNRIGNFNIKKDKNIWLMQNPKNVAAKSQIIKDLFSELNNLSIVTIHEYEEINIQSFSLNRPIIDLKIKSKDSEEIQIKFGILNRIDNTTYMSVSNKKIIYQVKLFKTPFESFELSDFIDSNVFSMPISNIKRLSLFSGKQADARNVLEYTGQTWISKRYRTISDENTEKKLDSILNIKTHMIIDETNEELKNFISNYLNSPLYRISILTRNGRTINYKISTLTKAINELKIPKRQFFIMSASDRPYPFLISKKFLDRFIIRYADLKK